ncbi:MAG: Hsp20/alpha crystallin family protein [Anaerolineaceae bacterium]|nr:MAG: Hsp20/alpha crystallin family protein [Anaerolineaceae bacterium]
MSTIVRWNPFREMAALQSAMDRMFDETWRNTGGVIGNSIPMDVNESDTAYTITAEMPGVNADNININLHDGLLTISAEIFAPEVGENERTLVQERVYGKFSRSVRLPNTVDIDSANASFDDGVLTLVLPKTPEVQPRQIPVSVGRNGKKK